ncbi:MAG TPA: hypothetical protein PLG90_00565 [Ignavibacteria bacterium]|nr:hypothetical protein [Ignavibacteria bacterium]
MRKYFAYFIFILICIKFLNSCTSSDVYNPNIIKKGSYEFTMFDTLNARLLKGTLTVENIINSDFSGSYRIDSVFNSNFPGYETMDADTFSGNFLNKEYKVFINTNPRIADANVFWNMLYRTDTKIYTGEWSFSVFRSGNLPYKAKVTMRKL